MNSLNTSDLPDKFIRGIPNNAIIDDDGIPTAYLFTFQERSDFSQRRSDGKIEESINWYDNEKSLEVILNQKKDNGDPQFKIGAAILSKNEFDHLCSRPFLKGDLTCERHPVPGNEFHGNILLKSEISKPRRTAIAAQIALCLLSIAKPDGTILDI